MDTIRVNNASPRLGGPVEFTKTEKEYSVIGLIGGFILMIAGIMANMPWLAAIGFVPMAVSFLYLNSML